MGVREGITGANGIKNARLVLPDSDCQRRLPWITQLGETMTNPSNPEEEHVAEARDHLDGVSDGCGCAEIWEYLSEER